MAWHRPWALLFVCLWPSLAAIASSNSGSLETTLVMNPLALGSRDALLPETLMKLTLQGQFAGIRIKSETHLDPDGLDYLELGAAAGSKSLSWDSTLILHPLGETKTKTKTSTRAVQLYDLGREYFVDSVDAENVVATSTWWIRTSVDNVGWRTIAGPLDPAVHDSGPIPVHGLIRYVELRATTGTLTASRSSPQQLTLVYSDQLWKMTLAIPSGSAAFSATMALSLAQDTEISLEASCKGDSIPPSTASVTFGLLGTDRRLCFERAALRLSPSVGCGDLEAKMEVDNGGTAVFSLAGKDVPSGLPGLTLSGELTVDVFSAQLEVKPQLELGGGTSLDLRAKALTGAVGTEIGGISLYGIGADCSLGPVELSALSYLDGTHHVPVLGTQSCSDAVTVTVPVATGRGEPDKLKCNLCFSGSSSMLADWAETDLTLELNTGPNGAVSVAIAIESAGLTYLSASALLKW